MTVYSSTDHLYLARGVYRAPVLSAQGHEIFFGVGQDHRLKVRHELMPGDNPLDLVARCWEELDTSDPEFSRRALTRSETVHRVAGFALVFAHALLLQTLI